MRPEPKHGIFSPWQFITILLVLSATGLIMNPDLLTYYAGKPDLLITEFLAENKTQLTDGMAIFLIGLKFTTHQKKRFLWLAGI